MYSANENVWYLLTKDDGQIPRLQGISKENAAFGLQHMNF